MTTQNILEARALSLAHNHKPLFAELNFKLATGEILALIGKSGCGKSTFLQLLAGLLKPDAGEILYKGKTVHQPAHACYLPQGDSLLPWLKLKNNLLLPSHLTHCEKPTGKQLDDLLQAFGLTEARNLYPQQMSGGMRQRAALLRAYMSGSKLLLLDEPLGALDAITRYQMQHWLATTLWQMQISAVLVTHDVEEALLLGDKLLVMQHTPTTLDYQLIPTIQRNQRFAMRHSQQFASYKETLWKALG